MAALRTRVFDLAKERGWNQKELAARMGIDQARVSLSKNNEGRGLTSLFITGALQAFPDKSFNDLFYVLEPAEAVAS